MNTEGDEPASLMTVREWYAGQALAVVAQYPGVRGHRGETTASEAEIAKLAFALADAMLAEGVKKDNV